MDRSGFGNDLFSHDVVDSYQLGQDPDRYRDHKGECSSRDAWPVSLGSTPFYVTAVLVMASVTLLTANWLIGLPSVIVLSLLAIRTPKEEQMLIERFGGQSRDYMVRTERFIPRFGRRHE